MRRGFARVHSMSCSVPKICRLFPHDCVLNCSSLAGCFYEKLVIEVPRKRSMPEGQISISNGTDEIIDQRRVPAQVFQPMDHIRPLTPPPPSINTYNNKWPIHFTTCCWHINSTVQNPESGIHIKLEKSCKDFTLVNTSKYFVIFFFSTAKYCAIFKPIICPPSSPGPKQTDKLPCISWRIFSVVQQSHSYTWNEMLRCSFQFLMPYSDIARLAPNTQLWMTEGGCKILNTHHAWGQNKN